VAAEILITPAEVILPTAQSLALLHSCGLQTCRGLRGLISPPSLLSWAVLEVRGPPGLLVVLAALLVAVLFSSALLLVVVLAGSGAPFDC
jgi:hypothetical protein